jgi:hypothetical protein
LVYILWPFGLFYGYLVYFVAIWYILWLFDTLRCIISRFGMLYQEKSGNPVLPYKIHFGATLAFNYRLESRLSKIYLTFLLHVTKGMF